MVSEWAVFDSTYVMDRYIKIFKVVRLIPYLAAQSILVHMYLNRLVIGYLNRDPLRWLSIMLYLIFCQVIFITCILNVKMCCRPKTAHPLGEQLTQEYFNRLERARNLPMYVIIVFIIMVFVYTQVYITGIQDIQIRGSSTLVETSSLVFTGLFAALSLLICCTAS